MRNCKAYSNANNYRNLVTCLASDGIWYVSTCDNNLCNNPIHKKTYKRDDKDYLFWISVDELYAEIKP